MPIRVVHRAALRYVGHGKATLYVRVQQKEFHVSAVGAPCVGWHTSRASDCRMQRRPLSLQACRSWALRNVRNICAAQSRTTVMPMGSRPRIRLRRSGTRTQLSRRIPVVLSASQAVRRRCVCMDNLRSFWVLHCCINPVDTICLRFLA